MIYSVRLQLYKDGKAFGGQNYSLLRTSSPRYAQTFVKTLFNIANSENFDKWVTAEAGEAVDDRNSRALRKARGALIK